MGAWLTGQAFTFDVTLAAPTFGDGGEATRCQTTSPDPRRYAFFKSYLFHHLFLLSLELFLPTAFVFSEYLNEFRIRFYQTWFWWDWLCRFRRVVASAFLRHKITSYLVNS